MLTEPEVSALPKQMFAIEFPAKLNS